MIQEDIHVLASLSSEMCKAGFQDFKEGKRPTSNLRDLIKSSKKTHELTNIQKKVKWCGEHLDYDLTKVIFTNETSPKWGSSCIKGWIKLGEQSITSQIKYFKKVNAWGAIAMRGKLPLKLFNKSCTLITTSISF